MEFTDIKWIKRYITIMKKGRTDVLPFLQTSLFIGGLSWLHRRNHIPPMSFLSLRLERISTRKSGWISIVSGIHEKLKHGIKIKHIADETGLSCQTISRLIYRETKSPRMMTIVILMKYLNYKLFARKTNQK